MITLGLRITLIPRCIEFEHVSSQPPEARSPPAGLGRHCQQTTDKDVADRSLKVEDSDFGLELEILLDP